MSDAKLLSPEELECKLQTVRDDGLPRTAKGLRAHIAALEAERNAALEREEESAFALESVRAGRDAALADNAALVKSVHESCPFCRGAMRHAVGPPNGDGIMMTPCSMPIHGLARGPHPGAALLEAHAKETATLTLARDMALAMHESAQKARREERAEHAQELVLARNVVADAAYAEAVKIYGDAVRAKQIADAALKEPE